MAQSSRKASRGQKYGGNDNVRGPSSKILSSSDVGSAPTISSVAVVVCGVSRATFDPVVARRQSREKKYTLWKYVTRK